MDDGKEKKNNHRV